MIGWSGLLALSALGGDCEVWRLDPQKGRVDLAADIDAHNVPQNAQDEPEVLAVNQGGWVRLPGARKGIATSPDGLFWQARMRCTPFDRGQVLGVGVRAGGSKSAQTIHFDRETCGAADVAAHLVAWQEAQRRTSGDELRYAFGKETRCKRLPETPAPPVGWSGDPTPYPFSNEDIWDSLVEGLEYELHFAGSGATGRVRVVSRSAVGLTLSSVVLGENGEPQRSQNAERIELERAIFAPRQPLSGTTSRPATVEQVQCETPWGPDTCSLYTVYEAAEGHPAQTHRYWFHRDAAFEPLLHTVEAGGSLSEWSRLTRMEVHPEGEVTPEPGIPDGLAPFPYTTDQIRDSWVLGLEVEWAITQGDETVHQLWTVVDHTPEQVTLSYATLGDDGQPDGELQSDTSTWTTLQHHASFAARQTTVEAVDYDAPWGTEPCTLYTVQPAEGEPPGIRRFWFGKDTPGAPLLHTIEVDGQTVMEMKMTRREVPE